MSADSIVENHRNEILAWIRKQYNLKENETVSLEMQRRVMSATQLGSFANDSAEVQELVRLISEFRETAHQLDSTAEHTVTIACKRSKEHAQPCICPFQWFYARKATAGLCHSAVESVPDPRFFEEEQEDYDVFN